MKLLNFLKKRSATIARLRALIVRLSTLVRDLTTRLDEPVNCPPTNLPNSLNVESASVLVDAQVDTSFLLKPNCDSQVDMTRLDHPNIQKQLAAQLARIRETENAFTRGVVDILRFWRFSLCRLNYISYSKAHSISRSRVWFMLYR
jgi:hypothetical protein